MASREEPIEQGGEQEREITVRVTLDPDTEAPTYYVNYAEVSHNQYEIGISVARLPTKFSNEQLSKIRESKQIQYKPLLQLVLPPAVIPGLIEALRSQLALYERSTATSPAKNSEES